MTKKIIIATVVGAMALGVVATIAPAAQAMMNQGGGYGGANKYGNGLEIKAEALDMTTEQLKEELTDSTLAEVVEKSGLTIEEYKENLATAAEEHWEENDLSDEEIQEKIEAREDRQADCDGTMSGSMSNRYGQNR